MVDLISTYANGVSELTKFTKAPQEDPLIVDVIVNPHAGFFKARSTLSSQLRELELKLADLRRRSPRRRVEINTLHFTEREGHARDITESILNDEARRNYGIERLLIGCGGDGTSNEICTALVEADGKFLDRFKLLRLPLGTGNDVADAPTFEKAYDLILGPQKSVKTAALLVELNGKPARYSFNIASIGLDAYIVWLTNRFKRVIPGDVYKLMVDVGTLFYERHIHQAPVTVDIHGPSGVTRLDPLVPSMVVIGISGGRTYGGHMPVLPGTENVMIASAMSTLEKIRGKKLFYVGRHGELPQVRFFTGHRVEVAYTGGTIPLQLDGELLWPGPLDFPISFTVLEPKIKVLRA